MVIKQLVAKPGMWRLRLSNRAIKDAYFPTSKLSSSICIPFDEKMVRKQKFIKEATTTNTTVPIQRSTPSPTENRNFLRYTNYSIIIKLIKELIIKMLLCCLINHFLDAIGMLACLKENCTWKVMAKAFDQPEKKNSERPKSYKIINILAPPAKPLNQKIRKNEFDNIIL